MGNVRVSVSGYNIQFVQYKNHYVITDSEPDMFVCMRGYACVSKKHICSI